MRFQRLILSAMMIYLTVSNAFAGAWTQDKGAGLIISGTSYNRANLAFDSQRKLSTPVDFEKIDSTFYAEYGVTNKLTLVGTTALQDVSFTSSEGPQIFRGFATSKLGLRYGVNTNSPWKLAVQPSLVIPAGGESIPDGDLGIGGAGAEMRLLAGRSIKLWNKAGFINAEAAYDYRSDGAPRQITTDLTIGVELVEHVQFISQAFYRHTNDAAFERDVILANESLKLQASVVIDLPNIRLKKGHENDEGAAREIEEDKSNLPRKTSLQLGVFQTVAGRNIVRERGVMLTLWNKF